MSTLALHLNKPYGYSCQAWLAVDIADRYFSSMYRVWFATTLNPRNNGYSSNPLVLYQELDQIVHSNDLNHSRIDQLRFRLTNWITGTPLSPSGLAPSDVADLTAEIASAPVAAFRPQLWRIELANIHITRLINLGQFPDEYQIRDLIAPEFEVIAE